MYSRNLSAPAFAADFPPDAPKFNQRTLHVRLINLCTSDKKSSHKIRHSEIPRVHFIEEEDAFESRIDYEACGAGMEDMRREALAYIKHMAEKHRKEKKTHITANGRNCSGCTACRAVCPGVSILSGISGITGRRIHGMIVPLRRECGE